MKVLALSDIHGKFFRLDGIIKKSDPVDVVVVAGDFTHGGPPENAVRSICHPEALLPAGPVRARQLGHLRRWRRRSAPTR